MKIDKKIVGYSVVKPSDSAESLNQETSSEATASGSVSGHTDTEPRSNIIQMHEKLERPQKLIGSTYKLKTPDHVSPHAMYITINDLVLNEGTENESRRPFEVFINSKNLEHYQWIVALTLIMSAVFRKGGDITFLVDELRSVFDPRGGYWNKGKYMPSIIAEIGEVIESHLVDIGMLQPSGPGAEQARMIEEKKAEYRSEAKTSDVSAEPAEPWMASATHCNKCHQKSVVLRDGCQTCMNCGDSKCG